MTAVEEVVAANTALSEASLIKVALRHATRLDAMEADNERLKKEIERG